MTYAFDSVQTLGIAIAVLYLGMFVIGRVGFLRDNDIPIPVVGGLLFALVTTALYGAFDVRLRFDMALKGPMMLAFFATIGLGADLRMLVRGGPQLLWFALVCLGYLVVQNGLGTLTAIGLGLHPLIGLLSGSITLSGGHGTGVAYAQRFHEVTNLAGAMELAMACATFGLVLGGLIGGPVAGRLIRRYRLQPGAADLGPHTGEKPGEPPREETRPVADPIDSGNFLRTVFYIVLSLIGGRWLASAMDGLAFTLPSFVWCLLIGVLLRNGTVPHARLNVHAPSLNLVGNLSLFLFLAMALMSMQLWELLSLAGPLLALLGIQVAGITLFATFVTFRFMGADYDAAVIAGGQCGFGMGATPTAVANMEALTRRFGPSPQAFLVVPLMGAFFIDLLNAIVIQGYLSLPLFGL